MYAPSLCQDEQLDIHWTQLNLIQLSVKLEKNTASSFMKNFTELNLHEKFKEEIIIEETIQIKHLV